MLVLIVLIVLPAVGYISFETATLSESEEMIREVYRQQLDAVLFSINQYVDDYIGSWRNHVNAWLAAGEKDFHGLITDLKGVSAMMIWETDLQPAAGFSGSGDLQTLFQLVSDSLQQLKHYAAQLGGYQKAGYQKLQPVLFETGTAGLREDFLLLLYMHQQYNGRPVLVGILLPVNFFIESVIQVKLNELAGDRFSLGLFKERTRNPVLPGQELTYSEAKQTKEIWLLPGYLIGIKLATADIEDLARERFYRDVVIISIICKPLSLPYIFQIFI